MSACMRMRRAPGLHGEAGSLLRKRCPAALDA